MADNSEGIEIKHALEILAQRTEGDSSENQCPCGKNEIPEGARQMGQTIELLAAGISPPAVDENEHKKIEKEREDRKLKLKEKLGTMTTKQLLQTVLDVQEQRVATYRAFDSGLESVLETRNLTHYPKVCAQATAEFSVLSETIMGVQKALTVENDNNNSHKDCLKALKDLQEAEKNKLNWTAALHLEQIRQQSEADEKIMNLLKESCQSLRSHIASAVETINESIDEIRIAVTEEC